MVIYENILSPRELKDLYLLDDDLIKKIQEFRNQIKNIIDSKDSRKVIIIGPCSIHNTNEAIEYAKKLKELSLKLENKFLIVMRVYFEKPRSSIGWKGFINDPFLDGSNNISEGLKMARKLLIEITKNGLPIATEFLDLLVYPYIEDLISFGAIGARTTESQTHRQIVSGLFMPVGFKNSTSGNIDVAINAIISSKQPHSFLGINNEGNVSKIITEGNSYCPLILRGGDIGPNYESDFVKESQERLKEKGLVPNIIIDCSHGNSLKEAKNQKIVFNDVIEQMKTNKNLIGVMIESNLVSGSQKLDLKNLKKGISITDECIGFLESEKLLMSGYKEL